MKIIIAGIGKIGAALARQLSAEGYELTLVDEDRDVLEQNMENFDVMSVCGNCATRDVLMQAGVTTAALLIAAAGADEVNLLCCTVAHGLNPKLHTIARIRNPEYSNQIYAMRDTFALSLTVNPERQAALEMERLIKYPGFLKRDTFAKGRVEIVELRVGAGSPLCNLPLNQLRNVVRCKVLVCVVLRGSEVIAPNGSFVLRADDRIFVTAPVNNLTTLLDSLGIVAKKAKRVLICGGGRVGYYLCDQLHRDGFSVQLIEKDAASCATLANQLPNIDIIHGDASNMQLLESEGISRYDSLVTVTGLDELNVIISLYGQSQGIPQVITKVSHLKDSGVLNTLPLGSIISPDELCCNSIVRYVRAMKNQTGAALAVHFIADRHAEAIEFRVDDRTLHCGEPLRQLKLRRNVLIACITHGGKTGIPDGDSAYQPGDTVIVVTSGTNVIYQLNDVFAE